MWFQNHIKSILKALLIACVVLVSPAFATPYNITYELNGGLLASGVSNPATYDDDTLRVLDLPIKDGYVFKGWYENSDFTGNPVKWVSANSTSGDKTYYAKWETTIDSKFEITTTDIDDDDSFSFTMSAAGVFYIDWGDGSDIEVIDRRGNTAAQSYSHPYDTNDNPNDHTGPAGSYTIRFDGLATGYNTANGNWIQGAAISFYNNAKLKNISGSLGALFPTIGGKNATKVNGVWMDGGDSRLLAIQPRFIRTFESCSNLIGSIPENLFNGVVGQPANYMFYATFDRDYNDGIGGIGTEYDEGGTLRPTHSIPVGLFSGIEGHPAVGMFHATFLNCSGLTGSIPAGLFSGISGAPATDMFNATFRGCSNLTGYIPATLFAGIDTGTTANNQMSYVFYNTGLLTSCPLGTTNLAITGFESYFGDKACIEKTKVYCREGYRFDTTTNACVECQSGDSCPDRGAEYTCPNGMGGNSDSTACIAPSSITYNLDGGTNNANNPSTYTNTIILKEPQKANYKFLGWYRYSDFSGGEVTTLVQENDGNVELYAKWAPFNNKFQVTTTNISDGEYVAFMLNAQGTFWVDWGDGIVKRIVKEDASGQVYMHTYHNNSARSYVIKFDGDKPESYHGGDIRGATITFSSVTYGTYTSDEGIVFSSIGSLPSRSKIAGISGSLGVLFPTLDDTDGLAANSSALYAIQPRFSGAFSGCTNLIGNIPDTLFDGIYGTRRSAMFGSMFVGCTNLGKNAVNGTSTYYLSPIIYQVVHDANAGIGSSSYADAFIAGTGFKSFTAGDSCPSGMRQVTLGQYRDGNWVYYLSCIPYEDIVCPWGYELVGNTCTQCSDEASCPVQEQTCSSGYIVNAQLNACEPYYTISYNNVTGATLNSAVRYYSEYDNDLCKYSAQDNWGQCSYNTTDDSTLYLNNPTKSGHLFLGWCDDAELTQNCSVNKSLYYNSSDSDGYTRNYYAKWAPIYSISYDTTGAYSVPYNPGNYWYDGNYYHYTDENSYEVNNGAIQLASPSGDQEFQGWYVCTSQQSDVDAAAVSNDCIGLVYSIPNPDGNQLSLPSNLWLYAKFAPATVDCLAGTYAVNNGNGLTCTTCQANNYCLGGYGLTAEAGNNGLYSCSSANPNKAYSDSGAQSPSDCYFRCPSYHGYSSDSTSPYYVPIKTEEPYNFFYSADTDPVWKDFNGDGVESDGECVKPAYWINLETVKCMSTAADLQEQFGDYYYALGLDQPCNPSNMQAGLISCDYDTTTNNYTGCSSMVTACDALDLQALGTLIMNGSASSDDFLNLELERKGLSQSTVNWNTFFKQNNSYINDISTLDSSANITKSAVGCDTQTCSAGEYARVEYTNGVKTSSSCETCPVGSYCPDSKTYSFANGDFTVDPTNSNVYTAGKFACPAASTSSAGSATCTCPSGSATNPAGNSIVNVSVGNMSTTKTPEVITLTDDNDNEYSACANVYVSAVNMTAFNNWYTGGMSSDDLLTQAGARVIICKYNATDSKYNECTPAFTACNGQIAQLMLADTETIISNLAPMFDGSSSLPDEAFKRVSGALGLDSLQTANACPDTGVPQMIRGSCATGYYWENYDDGKDVDYTGNNCCPDGYACCLAGSQYDFKAERCEVCSGTSCPTTYTERVVCPEGSYIDQSAIGTNNQCVTCPVGHYCPGIIWDATTTFDSGKYECADGSYNDKTGATSCTLCANGMSTGGATGSISDSACSTTTCVDGSQYDPAGATFVSGATKQSSLITLVDTKKGETYQECAKAYISVLDNTVFANGMANATADELSKSGMRLVICRFDDKENKYTNCSYAIPACDGTYQYMMMNYTTDQIAGALASNFNVPGIPDNIFDEDASGALGIDGVRNFYGNATSGLPTCAASCPVGYYWESYENEKNNETIYTGNTCCPDGYACCLAGWKYDSKEERCVECSGDNCPTTYTKSFVCPAGEYINQIGQNEYQCVTCDAGSYCPGIIWDVTTTFNSGKYTCAQNTFSGSGATECSACPTGSTSSAGSTSLSACTCPSGSATNPAGNSIVNVSVGNMSTIKTPEVITLTDDNDNEYSACANVYVSAVNMTAFNNWYIGGMSSDDLLTQAGARVIICKYNATDSKYNECTPAFTACNGTIAQLMLAPTGTIISNLAQMFGGGSSLSDDSFEQVSNTLGIDTLQTANACPDHNMPQQISGSCANGYYWENYDDGKDVDYTGNNCCPDGYACCLAGTKYDATTNSCQPCSGSSCPTTYTESVKPITCPATNGYYTSPALINTTGVPGVVELDMQNMDLGTESSYGSSQYECVAIRLYYENSTPFISAGGMENMTASDYVNAGASVAFCKYNSDTGHYDGNCTPKYSLCSTDNVMNLFASGDSVGVMKAVLGITNDATIDKYFTVSASDLSKESKQNRCGVVVCPDASDFSAMSLSGSGMMQMGNDMEGSYGSTPNECVAMRVYYNDGSVLFDGNSPSMDIDDWVDAGASVAFCKYNTGSSETDLCTPKYSMCSDDNLMTLMAAGNAVGIMQTLLGVNNASALGTYFTQAPESLVAATATNRCNTCESGHVCCAAGTYVNPDTATHGTENQCLACPVGHYCPGDDWDTTTNYTTNKTACGANKYNDQESQTSVSACNDCPVENSTGSSAGSSECGCSAGYHWDSSTHTCAANVVTISWDGINDPGDVGTCTYGGSFTAPSAPETTPQGFMFIGWRIVSSVSNSNNNDNSDSGEEDNGEENGNGE